MTAGRPTKFTQELADEICKCHARGETITSVCDKLKIGWSTVKDWVRDNSKFSADYARATDEYNRRLVDSLQDCDKNSASLHYDNAGRIQVDLLREQTQRRMLYLRFLAPADFGNENERGIHVDIEGFEEASGATKMKLIGAALRKKQISKPIAELLIRLAESQIKAEEIDLLTKQVAELKSKLEPAK